MLVGLLEGYSNNPALLDDLRQVHAVLATEDLEGDEPDLPPPGTDPEATQRSRISNRLSQADVQALIQRFKAGGRQQALADQYGISLSSVRQLVQQYGAQRWRRRDKDTAHG